MGLKQTQSNLSRCSRDGPKPKRGFRKLVPATYFELDTEIRNDQKRAPPQAS